MTQALTSRVLQNGGPTLYDRQMNRETTQRKIDQSEDWIEQLQHTYNAAVDRYQKGNRNPENVIPETSLDFLTSIGTSAQELFDFVEDWVDDGEPGFSTVAAITGVRRDYFLNIQKQKSSGRVVETPSLPSGREELGGFRWLPRIIAKAQAKLRGEMSPDIMFGCGADRPFLRRIGIDPAEFLRLVWEANDDKQVVLEAIKRYARTLPSQG